MIRTGQLRPFLAAALICCFGLCQQQAQAEPSPKAEFFEFNFPANALVAEITFPHPFINRKGISVMRFDRVLARGKFKLPREATLNVDLKMDALDNMDQVEKLKVCHVTKFDASKLDFEDNHLTHIKDFKEITELALFDTLVTDKSLPLIAHFQNLTTLVISHTDITGDGFKSLCELKHLRLLHASTIHLKKDALTLLKPLYPQLLRLNIGHNGLTDQNLCAIQNATKMQDLDISSNPGLHNDAIKCLAHMKNLVKINMEDTAINYKCLPLLTKLPKLNIAYVRQKDFWPKGSPLTKTGHVKITDVYAQSDMPIEALKPLH